MTRRRLAQLLRNIFNKNSFICVLVQQISAQSKFMLLHIREKVLDSVCVLVPPGGWSTCLQFTFPPVSVLPTTSLPVSIQVNNNILGQLSSTSLLPCFPLAFSFLTCHSPYTFLLPSFPFHPLNLLPYLPSFTTLPSIPTLFFTFLTTSTPLHSSSSPLPPPILLSHSSSLPHPTSSCLPGLPIKRHPPTWHDSRHTMCSDCLYPPHHHMVCEWHNTNFTLRADTWQHCDSCYTECEPGRKLYLCRMVW